MDSDLKDLLNGFFKPIRDLTSAAFVYALMVGGNSATSTIQNSSFSFNIGAFAVFFIMVSSGWEFCLGIIYDTRRAFKNPISSGLTLMGMLVGTVTFGFFVLVPVYYLIGGNVEDLIEPGIISAICMFSGMAIRLYVHNKRQYYY